jgi:spermidine synthase
MLFGALNLFEKSPKEILILCGGDGILLDMIQNNLPESSTTLVELDEKMIEWAQNNFFLKTLNQNVFSNLNKNNKVIIGDAIMELRKFQNKKQFDLIFIDFPFPNGHDLSKLYSEEFYSLVKNVSKEDTLVTIDLPLEMKNKNEFDEETLTILKTILKSGFKNQIGYGPHSSFVTVTQSRKPLSFNYKTLPNNLSLATKINLFSYIENKEIDKIEISKRVNSMFWPKRK